MKVPGRRIRPASFKALFASALKTGLSDARVLFLEAEFDFSRLAHSASAISPAAE